MKSEIELQNRIDQTVKEHLEKLMNYYGSIDGDILKEQLKEIKSKIINEFR